MNVIIQRCHKADLRGAGRQCAPFYSERIRCCFEFGFEAVNHGIQILKMDLAVLVVQAAGIASGSWIELRLKLQVVEIRIERALAIVVVNLALSNLNVTYTEIEDTGLLTV